MYFHVAISLQEDAVMDSHIWYQVDTREACILNEETVCLVGVEDMCLAIPYLYRC